MNYETWQDYWITNGYFETVGKINAPSGSRLTRGRFSVRELYNPSGPHHRYGLSINASPVWNEAGNVDPSVLEEWAAAHGVKIETPAGHAEQQDLKYVANGNGKTWYETTLRPWTIAREAGGEAAGPVEGNLDKPTISGLIQLLDIAKNLPSDITAALREELERIEDGVLDSIADGLKSALSILDADLRKLGDQNATLLAELKALKNQVARLAKGKP